MLEYNVQCWLNFISVFNDRFVTTFFDIFDIFVVQ